MQLHSLVILGHSRQDSFCGALAQAYVEGVAQAGKQGRLLKLAELEFNPYLQLDYEDKQPLEADLLEAQKLIEQAENIVIVTPFWWGSVPALLKGFLDRILLPGWAFKYEKGMALPKKLLKGRRGRLILTMDSPSWWYNFVYHRVAHRSMVSATMRFIGLKPVKVTMINKVLDFEQGDAQRWMEKVASLAEKDVRS